MEFGKHRGTPLSAVPKDYIQWIFRQGKKIEMFKVDFVVVYISLIWGYSYPASRTRETTKII